MGIWKEIKKAINSTLGTSDFLPLDKIIRKNKSLVASDEDYYILATQLPPSASEEIFLDTKFLMYSSGSMRLSAVTTYGDSEVNVYVNGILNKTLVGLSSDTPKTADIFFDEGDIITFSHYSTRALSTISDVKICASVIDMSMMDISE